MPRWNIRSAVCGALVVVMACGLAACGYAGGTGTMGASGTTGPTQGVVVEVGAGAYGVNDTINVTVRNQLSASIVATDHQTSCSIVQLQIEANGSWQNQGGCALGIATRQIALAAGSVTPAPLAPAGGQISAKPWPAGTYRVAFTYRVGGLETPSESDTAYSAPFTVS